jgi:hypothetical protein
MADISGPSKLLDTLHSSRTFNYRLVASSSGCSSTSERNSGAHLQTSDRGVLSAAEQSDASIYSCSNRSNAPKDEMNASNMQTPRSRSSKVSSTAFPANPAPQRSYSGLSTPEPTPARPRSSQNWRTQSSLPTTVLSRISQAILSQVPARAPTISRCQGLKKDRYQCSRNASHSYVNGFDGYCWQHPRESATAEEEAIQSLFLQCVPGAPAGTILPSVLEERAVPAHRCSSPVSPRGLRYRASSPPSTSDFSSGGPSGLATPRITPSRNSSFDSIAARPRSPLKPLLLVERLTSSVQSTQQAELRNSEQPQLAVSSTPQPASVQTPSSTVQATKRVIRPLPSRKGPSHLDTTPTRTRGLAASQSRFVSSPLLI